MLTPFYCPSCGKPMETFLQRDYRVRTSIEYLALGTCKNETCVMLNHTLTAMGLQGDLTKYGVDEAKFNIVTGLERRD